MIFWDVWAEQEEREIVEKDPTTVFSRSFA